MDKKARSENLNAIDSINNLLNHWWKIALIAILFGLLGLAFSYIQPPKYEAEAIFSATIDYRDINFENLVDETGQPLEFSQYDVDLALSAVQRALIALKANALQHGQTLDPSINAESFGKNHWIERLHDRWSLRYRHEDPGVAQSIVNFWAELAMTRIEAEQAAETIEPYVIVNLIQKAELPQNPTYQNRSTLMLAGIAIGFALGVLVFDFKHRYLPKKTKAD
jgi:uncharacterized protein involved in exopolysaccharide biosynthesis